MRRIVVTVVCLVTIGTLLGFSRGKPPTAEPLLASRWLMVSFRDGGREASAVEPRSFRFLIG